jgi:Tol biopolymer transport system component/predicted Ser/Thr protein kinase
MAAPSLKSGATLGPYQLLAPIGAGGMGEVWKARDTRLDRTVALKFARAAFSDRTQREAQAIAALNHPNIATLYDVGPDYLVMEYIEGSPVRPTGDVRKLLDLAAQIADGLAAAHAAGIVHRDLKPDNILVTRSGRVKILDFGLARQQAPVPDGTAALTITQPGTVVGTVAYMSPEQARGQELDARSDQFSFGLVLYELATGRRAFARETAPELMAAIIREPAPPLPDAVPAPLRWTIERCLAKDPEERYGSTRDLHLELRNLGARLSGAVEAGAQRAPRRRRGRVMAATVAAACLAAAALGVWVALRPAAPGAMLQYTPFATSGCNARMPAWSPDGRSIAYVCDVDGQDQLFTRALEGITPAQLTNASGRLMTPLWSTDGARIYFTLDRDLYFTGAAGGAPQLVLKDAFLPAISPDGRRLVVFRPADNALWLANPDGSEAARIERAGFPRNVRLAFSKFSPDGRTIASLLVVSERELTDMDLWLIPVAGGAPRRLSTQAAMRNFNSFSWLPDGRHILAAVRIPPALETHLFRVDTTTGEVRQVTAGPLREAFVAVSPDGRRVAAAVESESAELFEFTLDSGRSRSLESPSRENMSPVWVPSGRGFAWVAMVGGQASVLIQEEAGGPRAVPIAGPDVGVRGVQFSPDGQRLVLDCYLPKHRALLVPAAGGTPVDIDPGNADTHGGTFSPDGAWVAYTRYVKGGGWVTRVPSSGIGAPIDLGPAGASPGILLQWSPRGDWIASGNAGQAPLQLTSQDGKMQRVLLKPGYRCWSFNAKGDRIYGARRDDKRRWGVWSVDVASGVERKETALDIAPTADVVGFSLHPDGKRFLASIGAVASDIWIIDGAVSR